MSRAGLSPERPETSCFGQEVAARPVSAGRGARGAGGRAGSGAAFRQVGGAEQRALLLVLPCPSALGVGRGPAP